jgi:hypothetical protein
MRVAFTLMCALTLTLSTIAPVQADVPTEMSVQGRLTNGAGAPVPAGLKTFTFKIYDAQFGGVEIWPAGPGESQSISTDANGLWNAGVGENVPLTEAVFQSPVRWLQVTVNDGVNPAETLPRIELRTNPYTYRSATSQHADSLGSSTLTDLVDQFVDESGDGMTGNLRIEWSHPDTGRANLEVRNLNDGHLPMWALPTGTWGIASDVASDNTAWNIGTAGACQGDNTTNIGAYGVAYGLNSANYGVYGIAQNGTTNMAGYFQGDLYVSGSSTGSASVLLPTDAIASEEVFDEPGIAQGVTSALVNLTTSIQDLVTITIDIPDAGYIVVEAQTNLNLNAPTGFTNVCFFQIDEVAGGAMMPGAATFGALNMPNGDYFFNACSCRKTYFKSAGTYTFRLEGASVLGTSTNQIDGAVITATYFPTSYGSVSTVASQEEASDFVSAAPAPKSHNANAKAGLVSDPSDHYYVDLRELELRVARKEAEAERARRELLEARGIAASRTSQAPGVVLEKPNR